MEETSSPLLPIKDTIKVNKLFKKDNFTINIGKLDSKNQIIIKVDCPDEINLTSNQFSFDDLTKLIKPLKANENIDELYSNLIELFNNNEYSIKGKEDKIEISINLYNNKGIKESYSIFLEEKEQDNKQIRKNIIKKVLQLENENKLLKNENIKLSEEIINLKKQIEEINKVLFQIKNNMSFDKMTINSHIITNPQEFKFVLDRIEHISSKKIKRLDLLYRASENKGSGKIFHEKCDGKMPTITIIHTKNDYIFGGYTEKSWSMKSQDDNAFCFSINLKKIYPIMKGKIAIGGGGSDNGPIFYGSYNFIQIGKDAFSSFGHHSCDKTSNYEGVLNNFEISGGIEYFSILDYEVFHINFN